MPRFTYFVALTFALVAFTGLAVAQTSTGSVTGRVVDPSGAPIANAEVRLINQATKDSRLVPTGGNGDFVFVDVQPGDYALNIKVSGFKQFDKTGMHLAAS